MSNRRGYGNLNMRGKKVVDLSCRCCTAYNTRDKKLNKLSKKEMKEMSEEKRFLTEEQIVEDIMSKMTEEDRETWKDVTDDEIYMSHHYTGRTIRNEYNLWDVDNPYTLPTAEPNAQGVIDNPLFPDQVSHRIMVRIRDLLNNED